MKFLTNIQSVSIKCRPFETAALQISRNLSYLYICESPQCFERKSQGINIVHMGNQY